MRIFELKKVRVSEIFGPTVQGEGPLIGKPTVFVRTGGCDYRCNWCDTLYAVLPKHSKEWIKMGDDQIINEVNKLSNNNPILISLSGGNPAMHNLENIIQLGKKFGHTFALETQGSIAREWFKELDYLLLSPKPPSSGEEVDWKKFDDCLNMSKSSTTYLKIVIFDDEDYDFAKSVSEKYKFLPCYLQVGNPIYPDGENNIKDLNATLMENYRWLIEKTSNDNWFNATILPQIHVLTWGTIRGV